MAWLIREEEVLAALDLGEDRRIGAYPEGAQVLRRPTVVHTLRCPSGVDVAWCVETADGLQVRHLRVLARHRVALPRPRCPVVVVAGPGAFERWKLRVGDLLTVRE
jgi:hypothetical protein